MFLWKYLIAVSTGFQNGILDSLAKGKNLHSPSHLSTASQTAQDSGTSGEAQYIFFRANCIMPFQRPFEKTAQLAHVGFPY